MIKLRQEILATKKRYELQSWIYFLIKDNDIVYVGQTTQGKNRIYAHLKEGKKDFNYYAYIDCNIEDLDKTENEYIIKFDPKYNKLLNNSIYEHFIKRNKAKKLHKTTLYVINKLVKKYNISSKKILNDVCYNKKEIKQAFQKEINNLVFVHHKFRLPHIAKRYK